MRQLDSSRAFAAIPRAIFVSTLLLLPAAAFARENLPVGPFRSVTLRNGAHATVRHGSKPLVTLLQGSREFTSATIRGDELIIDRCPGDCPKGYRSAIEIQVPELDGLSVHDGGVLETSGAFPGQPELRVSVESGGVLDLRSMSVQQVTAAVRHGGLIYTKPGEKLIARIAQGGAVTYWGKPDVSSSVQNGGVVARGRASDVDKPLEELGPGTSVLPAVPAVPVIPKSRTRRVSI